MPGRRPSQTIPVHRLELARSGGFELHHVSEIDVQAEGLRALEAHRDDHYLFFLVESGGLKLHIDFSPTLLRAPCFGYILPGQVHQYQQIYAGTEGWIVAIDADSIDTRLRESLDGRLNRKQYATAADIVSPAQCLQLAKEQSLRPGPFPETAAGNLVNAFIGMVAAGLPTDGNVPGKPRSRSAVLVEGFLRKVSTDALRLRNPAAFANELAISVAYLNEVAKRETGFPASYWIHHEIALEAKRLLYYTDLSIKEIAARLNFEDAAYFSRFFRKQTELTPLDFRSRHRDSS